MTRQIDGLDFIPLMRERFDLVVRKELAATDEFRMLQKVIMSSPFRKEISTISGNDYSDMGKIIAEG